MCARHGLVALGARTTGKANLARGHHEELTMLERFSVFLQDNVQVFDLGLQMSSWEPKEDDAGVNELLVEDQLTEIAVSHNQNPLFLPGDRQDILIGPKLAKLPQGATLVQPLELPMS